MIRAFIPAGLLLTVAFGAHAQNQDQDPRVDQPNCTRAQLEKATANYVEAQKNGDISALPLADNAQFLENMTVIDKAEGLWNKALPIAYSESFHDPTRCKTFTEIVVTDGGHPYVVGTRLYMHDGNVIRVDSLVTDKGDWLFNAEAYEKYASQEDWSDLPKDQRTSAEAMIEGANAYLDLFSDKFREAPWGRPCTRLEGGAYTNSDGAENPSCKVGIPEGILYINNRNYLVDEEKGVINIFCRFGNSETGTPDSHTFRYIDGQFRYIHTISVWLDDSPAPQADADGNIIEQ